MVFLFVVLAKTRRGGGGVVLVAILRMWSGLGKI